MKVSTQQTNKQTLQLIFDRKKPGPPAILKAVKNEKKTHLLSAG
jgi:hypothetical protein